MKEKECRTCKGTGLTENGTKFDNAVKTGNCLYLVHCTNCNGTGKERQK